MRALLRHFMAKECEKHTDRHFEYLFELDQDIKRKTRRLGKKPQKQVHRPFYWALDDRFDPFKTRVDRKLDLFSYTLARQIARGQYSPNRAVHYTVKKEDGSPREVSVFQIPDAAVSTAAYKSR